VKQPRIRRHKIDPYHTTTGIFLGFTSTDRTIWFEDIHTGELKSARHLTFDEAHYTLKHYPAPYAQELMNIAEERFSDPTKKVSPLALPLHLILALDVDTPSLPPPLDQPIITVPPPNESSHAIRYLIPDSPSATPTDHPPYSVNTIPDDDPIIASTVTAPTPHTLIEFERSSNPFGNSANVSISIKGDHPTLGLEIIKNSDNARLTLHSCTSSTPLTRIPRWRSTLRSGIIIAIDNQLVDTIADITTIISTSRDSTTK